jgi:hypothetical protein
VSGSSIHARCALALADIETDPVLTAIVEEFVESLASQPHIVPSLVHALAPKLTAAITSPTTDETVHIPGEAVQLANALLRSRGGPLEEELVASVGKGVMRLLRATDDTEVIQVSGLVGAGREFQ